MNKENSFSFEGEVDYLKPSVVPSFKGTMRLNGFSKRDDCSYYKEVKMIVHLREKDYNTLKNKGVLEWNDTKPKQNQFYVCNIEGHLETWTSQTPSGKIKEKNIFICDKLCDLEVS